ncbi:hypothetical protein ABS71_02280 [bacterium SCN 62-11]|nr:hypothetical protein [Candidatus Eremiobacteraeota bacterium]ODT77935.1 MAG: hypothetical protein ABS71_02280 [bacterium SCN 62-11]
MRKGKLFCLTASLLMLFACWRSQFDPSIPAGEVVPVTAMMVAITHAVWRGPYRPLRWWHAPGLLTSLLLAGWGAWTFQPQEETGLRAFFTAFIVLALSYGIACTATLPDTPWRRHVLEPTRRFAGYSIPFVDFGLVFAPFLFPILALRYFIRSPRD